MKVKCDYCGNYIDESDQKCSFCGAANTGIIRTGNGVPKTIEELKQWYKDHNLPDENVTRFFIGNNYTGPQAIGIYKDENTGDFVVYKNKSDGSRVTRYAGNDEAYAVQEIYLKLKEAVQQQKLGSAHRQPNPSNYINNNYTPKTNNSSNVGCLIAIIVVIIFLFVLPVLLGSCGAFVNSVGGYGGGSPYYGTNYSTSYDSSYNSSNNDYSSNSNSWWSSSWDSDDWDSTSSWDSDWGSSSWDFDSSSWDSDW